MIFQVLALLIKYILNNLFSLCGIYIDILHPVLKDALTVLQFSCTEHFAYQIIYFILPVDQQTVPTPPLPLVTVITLAKGRLRGLLALMIFLNCSA